MRKTFPAMLVLVACVPLAAQATPQEDLKAFRDHFFKRFPGVEFNDFGNGVYSIDEGSRAQWEAIEEFPPYELAIEEGENLFNTPFKNGKTYASCFRKGGIGIRQNYPYFDAKKGKVKTLEQENAHLKKLSLNQYSTSKTVTGD